MEKPTELCDLPEDVLVVLFSHLSLRDRLRVRQVSKLARAVVGLSCTSTGRVFTDPRTTAAEVQQLLTEAGPRLSSLCASAELLGGLSPEQCARLTRLFVWKGDYFTSVELLALLERFPKAAVEVQCLILRDNAEQLSRLHAQRARVEVVGSLDMSELKAARNETEELVACLLKDDISAQRVVRGGCEPLGGALLSAFPPLDVEEGWRPVSFLRAAGAAGARSVGCCEGSEPLSGKRRRAAARFLCEPCPLAGGRRTEPERSESCERRDCGAGVLLDERKFVHQRGDKRGGWERISAILEVGEWGR